MYDEVTPEIRDRMHALDWSRLNGMLLQADERHKRERQESENWFRDLPLDEKLVVLYRLLNHGFSAP